MRKPRSGATCSLTVYFAQGGLEPSRFDNVGWRMLLASDCLVGVYY